MTIVVYYPKTDRILVDSAVTITGLGKSFIVCKSKVSTSPLGNKFTISGTCEMHMFGGVIDEALENIRNGKLSIIPLSFSNASVYVRSKEGIVYISAAHGDQMILATHEYDYPCSRAAGGYAFDAYYAEHKDVDKAMELVCLHIEGCGFPIESF